MPTAITKEYVEGGMNIITTTTEFVSNEVLENRATLARQALLDAQELVSTVQNTVDEIENDQNQIQ